MVECKVNEASAENGQDEVTDREDDKEEERRGEYEDEDGDKNDELEEELSEEEVVSSSFAWRPIHDFANDLVLHVM